MSIESAAAYLGNAFVMTLHQLVILIGPGLLLAFLMHHLAKFVSSRAYKLLGRNTYIYLFAGIGTVVHELGHAVFCVIFRHRITEMKLFEPDSAAGHLGYVSHAYDRTNRYQVIGNFFIGIGPILFGSLVIYLLASLLMGNDMVQSLYPSPTRDADASFLSYVILVSQSTLASILALCRSLFQWKNLMSWQLYVFLYLVFSVGSSISLSRSDLKGAGGGFLTLALTLFLLNTATMWLLGNDVTRFFQHLSQFYATFYTVMLLAILLNAIIGAAFLAIPSSQGKK